MVKLLSLTSYYPLREGWSTIIMTKIKACTCKHEQQDAIYGKGRRVMNKTEKKPAPQYRCTVCGNLHLESR